jgi:8-oxo-dGTP pyrophosphatase MutT (NUDIX family)
MAFDIPRDEIFDIDDLDVRLERAPHPFIAGREREVAERWAMEKAVKPALFDGEVVLLSKLAYRDGRLEGRCHVVRYSEFLYWRSQRPVASAEHAYAHAVLVASDNALVAIRMASHTVNAGLVYFAAGSFEPLDFPNGRVDVDFNMRREVKEETGIDLARCRAEPSLHALSRQTGTVIFRRYFADRPGEELAEAIRVHAANGGDDEIEDAVLIRKGEALPEKLAPHMPALVDWHFSRGTVSEG